MSLQVDSVNSPAPQSLEPEHIVLLRKLILLSLLMIVAALGLVLLLRRMQINSLFLPQLLSDAAMGLFAGLSARWVLHRQTALLRTVSMIAFLVGGLEMLGWFTGWQIGLGQLKPGLSRVDWLSLGQLLLASGVSLLALHAWAGPDPNSAVPFMEPVPGKRTPHPRQKPGRPRKRTLPSANYVSATHADPAGEQASETASARKPQVQLSEEEEHRCPYCLELIEPDDPLGVVECKICHTLHHADCWAITGTCQVPHLTV